MGIYVITKKTAPNLSWAPLLVIETVLRRHYESIFTSSPDCMYPEQSQIPRQLDTLPR